LERDLQQEHDAGLKFIVQIDQCMDAALERDLQQERDAGR
jgi:hypothetical protein